MNLSEFSNRTVEDVDNELIDARAELERLKAKLSDTENRIRRLEAGKGKLGAVRLASIAIEAQRNQERAQRDQERAPQQTRPPETPQQVSSQQRYPTPGPSAQMNAGFQHQTPFSMAYNSTSYPFEPYTAPQTGTPQFHSATPNGTLWFLPADA